jgi:hypothetical protein
MNVQMFRMIAAAAMLMGVMRWGRDMMFCPIKSLSFRGEIGSLAAKAVRRS